MKSRLIIIFLISFPSLAYSQGFSDRIKGMKFGAAMAYEGVAPKDIIRVGNQLNQMYQHENAKQYVTAAQLGYGLYQTLNQIGGRVLNTYIYASFLDHFACNLNGAGLSSVAIYYGLEAERRWKRIGKETDKEYINSVINLSVFYQAAHDIGESEKWIDRGISLTKNVKKRKNEYYRILNTKACLYDRSGRHEEALEIEEEVIRNVKEAPLFYRVNLIQFMYLCGRRDDALSRMRELVQKYLDDGLEKNYDYAELLQHLGVYYESVDINESIRIISEAISVLKENGTTLNSVYAQCLGSLAIYYHKIGRMEDALKYQEHAQTIWDRICSENSPDRLTSLRKLSTLQFDNNMWDKAQQNLIACTQAYNTNIMYSMMQDNKTRTRIWNSCKGWFFSTIPLFAYKIQTEPLYITLYNAALLSKGLLLNTEQSLLLMAEDGGPEVRSLYDQWRNVRRELASPHSFETDGMLSKRCNELEKKFMQECRAMKDVYSRLSVQWNNVRDVLSEKDVSIEFVDFPIEKDTIVYAALLLQKESQGPQFIPIAKLPNDESLGHLYDNISLSELIWGRLEPFLKDKVNIFFSPSGDLFKIPIESLPDWKRTSKIISDRGWKIYRLSSTRELLLNKDWKNHNVAVIYGGLNYDAPGEHIISNESVSLINQESGISKHNIDSIKKRGAIETIFSYLPGTRIEVDNVYQIVSQSYTTQLYRGNEGSEASFKSYDGKRADLMHIATHGFYVESNEKTIHDDLLLAIHTETDEDGDEDALNYTGLIFAGANNIFLDVALPETVDDGLLTAKEISSMDLRGLDMVALSACQTAEGDITGDGVFGLQRGFKKAGAQSILMSLWKVDDEATCLLMTEFYKNWIGEGKTKHDALELAKQTVRSHKEKGWDDPKYWAAFILLDALD